MTSMMSSPYDDWEPPEHRESWEDAVKRMRKERSGLRRKAPKGQLLRDVILPNVGAGVVILLFLFACGVVVAGTVMQGR